MAGGRKLKDGRAELGFITGELFLNVMRSDEITQGQCGRRRVESQDGERVDEVLSLRKC